ncbi:Rho GTPase activation protein [Xylaria sp. CBS 124048]|nr:Rho GTPase activation protein [Xylaria sp. CBS 124048]
MIDISRILIQMDQLRTRLPEEFEKSPSYFSLHEYMVHLKRYADTVISRREALYENRAPPQSHLIDWTEREPESGPYLGGDHLFGAYVGDGPDSAIDSDTEIQWPVPPSLPVRSKDGPLSPIDEMREPSVDIPSRAPTPPPKDAKRLRLLEMKRLELLAAKSLMPSVPEQAKIPPPLPERRRPKTAQTSLGTRQAEHPKKLQKRVARVRSQERMYVPSIISTRSRGLGRLFASSSSKKSIAESGRSTAPSITATTASTTPDIRPITPVVQASVVRRRSGRLSIHLKKLPLWNLDLLDENPSSTSSTSSSTSNSKAVFGVSLQKSMQTAKGITKTHHSGDRSSSSSSSSFSSSSSRREFPLCMQKCCFHLQNHGVTAPDIFAEPGDIFRVSKLKEIFSQAPRYGADLDLANNNNNNNNINNNNYYYTAYDVADLIMLFLSQLPRPLVPESLAKRWVALSRRVARAEAHAATRLDGCIDFWEEALSGLRGPSRSLVKLLLNLWADVAAAEKENDMSAERLAAVVLKPLTHVARGQQRTDYALALAFLIRKRVEYAELLGQNRSAMNRIRRAAW